MMKRKTRLFRHFMTCLSIGALSLPLLFLVVNVCRDVFPKLFASFSVQHHGGTSDVFSNDLDYAKNTLQFNDFNDTILNTLDNFHYFNYDNSVTNLSEWLIDNEGSSYADVIQNTSSHFIVNFSVVSYLSNGLVSIGNTLAPYLLIDYMCNYIINMSIVIFLPQVIMCFFTWCTNFVYTFTDYEKEDK